MKDKNMSKKLKIQNEIDCLTAEMKSHDRGYPGEEQEYALLLDQRLDLKDALKKLQ